MNFLNFKTIISITITTTITTTITITTSFYQRDTFHLEQ